MSIATRIQKAFKGALPIKDMINVTVNSLYEEFQFTPANTLVATSFCADETSRRLENELQKTFHYTFHLGGLAGFPFTGNTGYRAMMSHVPDNGNCLLIYGPHVGVDDVVFGHVPRRGMKENTICCGSAITAATHIHEMKQNAKNGNAVATPELDLDPILAQQAYVTKRLFEYADRLENAEDRMVELPYCNFEAIEEMLERILKETAGQVTHRTAVLGGIQINGEHDDYFLPLKFTVRDQNDKVIGDLITKFKSAAVAQ